MGLMISGWQLVSGVPAAIRGRIFWIGPDFSQWGSRAGWAGVLDGVFIITTPSMHLLQGTERDVPVLRAAARRMADFR